LAVLHSFKNIFLPASAGQGDALPLAVSSEDNPNTLQLEPIVRLSIPHFTHSRPVCDIFQAVYMR